MGAQKDYIKKQQAEYDDYIRDKGDEKEAEEKKKERLEIEAFEHLEQGILSSEADLSRARRVEDAKVPIGTLYFPFIIFKTYFHFSSI